MLSALASRTKMIVDFFFPVRGHSYLPADRAFGRVEKRIRRHETILLPQGYFEEFRKEGEILEYPAMWSIFDLKSFAKNVVKTNQASEISQQRWLRFTDSSALRTSTDFGAPLKEFSVLKRGKRFSEFRPADLEIAPQNRIKEAKKQDVMRLLDIVGVGENHPAYPFYQESCGGLGEHGTPHGEDSSSEEDDSE